ncbi:MAG TPA: dihydropteroate synthase [Gaiellales bacterium]
MTTISSPSRTIELGDGLPFCVIGERADDTADALDLQLGPEPAEAVLQARRTTALPFSLDSADPEALAAALAVYEGRALVNSASAEPEQMHAVLALVRRHGAAVIALPYDGRIPATAAERLGLARRILEAAEAHGIARDDVVVDALALPLATDPSRGRTTLETIRAIRAELGVGSVLGLSNLGYGRGAEQAAFLAEARAAGLSAAIMDTRSAAALAVARDPKEQG